MSTTEIRKLLHSYIETAEDRKIKAIYTIVENEIEFEDKWSDEAFVIEMDKRMSELESGKVKGYSMEEVKAKVSKSLRVIKKR